MTRLFIVIPVYAFVILFLHRLPEFQAMTEPLNRIHPDIAFYISIAASVVGAAGIWFIRNRSPSWALRRPRVAEVIGTGLMGLFIAGVFNIFEKLSGLSTGVVSLITVPVAFVIAESIYLAIQWRMAKQPD